jgi:hypothetical protein
MILTEKIYFDDIKDQTIWTEFKFITVLMDCVVWQPFLCQIEVWITCSFLII